MKINMNFLQSATFSKLAEKIDTDILDTLRERKDKFITKLFDRKLQALLTDKS
jgi:transcriptional accessory protein Tex/SPT6